MLCCSVLTICLWGHPFSLSVMQLIIALEPRSKSLFYIRALIFYLVFFQNSYLSTNNKFSTLENRKIYNKTVKFSYKFSTVFFAGK